MEFPKMRQYTIALFLGVPILFFATNIDIIKTITIIFWTAIILPLCIVQSIDYIQEESKEGSSRKRFVQDILRMPIGCFGVLSFLIGLLIFLFGLYNLFIKRLPEFTGDFFGIFTTAFGFLSFGISTIGIAVKKNSTKE
jgi:Zn-dependent protease with chaperone function